MTTKVTLRTVGQGVVLNRETYYGEFEWDFFDEAVQRLIASGHLEVVTTPVDDLPRNLELYEEEPYYGDART